jgi:hypothetical protein
LRGFHALKNCRASHCKHCEEFHHSLLHQGNKDAKPPIKPNSPYEKPSEVPKGSAETQLVQVSSNVVEGVNSSTVLLMTALVNLHGPSEEKVRCRVLLDHGSMASFITEQCVTRLGLKRSSSNVLIQGIANSSGGKSRGQVECFIGPIDTDQPTIPVSLQIMSKLTGIQPVERISKVPGWSYLKNLKLADPTFHTPGPIDLLIGSDILNEIMLDGFIKSQNGGPAAYNTIFGYVLCGPVKLAQETTPRISVHFTQCNNSLEQTLRRFWEIEDTPSHVEMLSEEEIACEAYFKKTVQREESGRYTVRLPFKEDSKPLGNSLAKAERQFLHQEKRLSVSQPSAKAEYKMVMEEYISLKHMHKIDSSEVFGTDSSKQYFLPHHGVYRENSQSRKLRIVFDASSKSANGVSLNDNLMIGPKLQNDLVGILMRFRLHNVAMTSDVRHMYRQIKVHPEDAPFQRIVWRSDPSEPLQYFQLDRVTFGTSAAPYLAIKTLNQVAEDDGDKYPLAKEKFNDFYVDDWVSGFSDVNTAMQAKEQLVDLLEGGGFSLHKWASNVPELTQDHSQNSDDKNSINNTVCVSDNATVGALGLHWSPHEDFFQFEVQFQPVSQFTKRNITSSIAKLFDPMGWLAPVVVKAKCFLQSLWLVQSVGWDDQLPEDIAKKWSEYEAELPQLESLKIPRKILDIDTEFQNVELHGYSDSSESCYACAIYLKGTTQENQTICRLIVAKTKVAPLKQVSLPRLELCAAVLLAKLFKSVLKVIPIPLERVFCWSDSCVVLAWLQGIPRQWKTFVANRVSYIQEIIPPSHWYYVKSEDNPADCASRGITPSELINHPLWWSGPPWLIADSSLPPYPTPNVKNQVVSCEAKAATCLTSQSSEGLMNNLVKKYSSMDTLLRVTAYVQRFIYNCRQTPTKRRFGPLTSQEYQEALHTWIREAQNEAFDITTQAGTSRSASIRKLDPFLDDEHWLLRVGGRIQNSSVSYNAKHPCILPAGHPFVKLLVLHEHRRTLHAGVQAVLSSLRQRYWILSARRLVKECIHQCVPCFKAKPVPMQQMMGSLPEARVQFDRTFSKSGVDFAGPLVIRSSNLRKYVVQKVYLCLFVCMATRSVHLELVSDLTSEAFTAALKRFVSRRGLCSEIYSDNGTNMVGAARELIKITKDTNVANYLSSQNISWHFIPPGAPHFGGLWEAGVKSAKHHLNRIVGKALLTFEELNTVIVEIEACLNSRPLVSLSDDPSSLDALTPGHFLVGAPLNAIPEKNFSSVPDNRLKSRWNLVKKITQNFWIRWHKEFLSTLQSRPKWCKSKPNLEVNDLVVIKDENLSPLQWVMGRITEVFPGRDGCVRVADVKTKSGIFRRPIAKLCLLPGEN